MLVNTEKDLIPQGHRDFLITDTEVQMNAYIPLLSLLNPA